MPIRVTLSPQFSTQEIDYELGGEVLHVTIDGQTDSFDLAELADEGIPEEGVPTSLPVQPIVAIKREDDQLHVTLLKFINLHASHSARYPQPFQAVDDQKF